MGWFAFIALRGAKDTHDLMRSGYVFLTTPPNALVATIDHERMPVLLTREDDFETWLSGAPKEAMVLAQEYPPSAVRIVQEGSDHEDRFPVAEIDARQKCQQDLAGSR